ncbi:MAG: anthranilate phosphoribosyltransferase [Planctomyces sp.]|nr:anthranilate phosphoribosyltransferase [Planctomyces sp.]MBA4120367.1 anthranilate phosphoribosyltransferase [Isosphaera sp.]
MRGVLERLCDGHGLLAEEAEALVPSLADPATPEAMVAGVLVALRCKGETAPELAGLARGMLALAVPPAIAGHLCAGAVDIVGTGGDASGSYNISTGAALLAAAAGATVLKHGNRAISGRVGSADVLEKLGWDSQAVAGAEGRWAERHGFAFLLAPVYHAAVWRVGAVRRALGVRTVFNVLGPLTNPARPGYSVVGAYSPQAAERMAGALALLGVRGAAVVHSENGWDEATPCAPFARWDVRDGRVRAWRDEPGRWGVIGCAEGDLRGGDAAHNAAAISAALRGRAGPLQEALVLNAAIALEVAGRAPDPAGAVARARGAIAGGAAARLLDAMERMGQGGGAG